MTIPTVNIYASETQFRTQIIGAICALTTVVNGIAAGTGIADNSIAYSKLVNATGGRVLGATGAGAIGALTVAAPLSLAGGGMLYTFVGPTAVLVSALGAATAGKRAFVSDATAPAFGSPVVGLGAVYTSVFADGSNWIVG